MSENEWLMFFSDSLLTIMEEHRMSQRELAERSGVSDGTISKYINGIQIPKITALVNIALALDCSIDELAQFDEMIER